MNELDIQVLKVKPAEIEFNHKEIMDELDGTLKRYKGVVHTEETTSVLRKDIATLRRAKKSINRFRIDRKNEMLEPITEFENKIKQIEQKVEEVEFPLSQQEKEFEEKRRDQKLIHVKNIREKVYDELDLTEIPLEAITIEDSYLTKTKTLTKIEEEMSQVAYDLKKSYLAKKQNEEIVKLTLDSLNAQNNLNLPISPYLSQLELNDLEGVKRTIEKDIQSEITKRDELHEKEKERQKEAERLEKEQAEKEAIEAEEAEEIQNIITNNETEVDQDDDVEDYNEDLNSYALSFMATEEQFNEIEKLLNELDISYLEL